jgi:hypothetical protein
LIERNKDSLDNINKRVEISAKEVIDIENSDFFYFKIVNDDLNVSFSDFKKSVTELYSHLKTE